MTADREFVSTTGTRNLTTAYPYLTLDCQRCYPKGRTE